jgi:penicillin-binding protein 1B
MESSSSPLSPHRPTLVRWTLWVVVIAFLVFLTTVGFACLVVRIPEGGSRQSLVFYSAALDLVPGSRLHPDVLLEHLRRLGYRAVDTPPESGQFREIPGGLEIHLRPFRYPDHAFPGVTVRVGLRDGDVEAVEPLSRAATEDLRLEPERIAGFENGKGAILDYLPLDEAPRPLVDAILTVEDSRFWNHPGVDAVGVGRAIFADLRKGEAAQGGSTLTQQLARSLFLDNRKTLPRKAWEAVLAVALELRYSKREILEAYLNAVYWGQWGGYEIRGAREASRYYLGRELEDADLAGLALLAGLIRAPNAYSPYVDPERARRRRDLVLGMLKDNGKVTEKEYEAAIRRPLPMKKPPLRSADASFFIEASRQELERRAPPGTLEGGVSVFTTLDPDAQTIAVAGLRQGLQGLERDYRRLRRKKSPLEAAVVVMEPETGEVKALVGGRDYLRRPFNRATDARRQPGSLFKPFVYLAAFRGPARDDGTYWTPATVIEDTSFSVMSGGKLWQPQNYDETYRGPVTARQALEQSLNVPTARVGYEIGLDQVAATAHALGIQSRLDPVPSLALGTSEVTLLEITAAYAALANAGSPRAPTFLRACTSRGGEAIPLRPLEDAPGVRPEEAYLITNLLEGVITSGTGHDALDLGVEMPAAGKTGTTDAFRDAWFVGYDRRRSVGVWVGFDQDGNVGLSGAAAALPIWSRIFAPLQARTPAEDFRPPPGIVSAWIDPESGLLATDMCPNSAQEVFLAGTEPTQECDLHSGGFFLHLRRLFGL